MSISKTPCIVLSMLPYRETSSIIALLSREHGRVSGIAKGIRRSPNAPLTLERGLVAELFLYVKPHRDLHTIGASSVVSYFPSIRSDLGKLALRDAAFELILKSTAASEAHPELFLFARSFLEELDTLPAEPTPVPALWRFIGGWAHLLGFKLNLSECIRCKSAAVATEGGSLAPERGGLVCPACLGGASGGPSFLPGKVAVFLRSAEPMARQSGAAMAFPPKEQMRITRLLADYFRYHCDIRGELKTVAFLESIL